MSGVFGKLGIQCDYRLLANMKVITSIYLNCRPDLRDEWLTGLEVEDVQGALVCGCFISEKIQIKLAPIGPRDCSTNTDQIL